MGAGRGRTTEGWLTPAPPPEAEAPVLSALVIAAVILAILGPTVKRALDLPSFPWIAVPVALVAATLPCTMAWLVLNPGPAVDEADISPLAAEVQLQVPPGHALLVTANLAEDPKGAKAGKTAYALAISGDGWASKATGEVRRKTSGDDEGVEVDVLDGAQLTESGKRRSGKWGEDLEDRFNLKGDGAVRVQLTNFDGDAASGLHLRVIEAPPPAWLLWPVALGLGAVGLAIELKKGPTQLGGDIAFLALYGVFLRDGVTPADSFQRIAFAAFPAAVVGWGIFASIGYLVERRRAKAAKEEERKRTAEETAQQAEALRKRRGR